RPRAWRRQRSRERAGVARGRRSTVSLPQRGPSARGEEHMPTMQFGVTLPQIKRSWQDTRAAAEEFERLGFHSVWFNDHLYGIPMPSIPIMEAWTALSAVAAITTRVELGTLVSPVGFRNPALLAKMAATLDQISGGRVIVGLGAGWFEQEYRGYGF